jgi:hypothetical protein
MNGVATLEVTSDAATGDEGWGALLLPFRMAEEIHGLNVSLGGVIQVQVANWHSKSHNRY